DTDGSNSIQLKQYPVSEIVSLHYDPLRVYGDDTLINPSTYDFDKTSGRILLNSCSGLRFYGDGNQGGGAVYYMASSNPGTPLSGINSNLDDVWKVVYKAGFNHFEIQTDVNDTIEWQSSEGNYTAVVDAGDWLGDDLATEMQTKMNAQFIASDPYTVIYSQQSGKFTFTSTDTPFILKFFNGDFPEKTIGDMVGFDQFINQSSVSSTNWGEWISMSGTATNTPLVIPLVSESGQIKIMNNDFNDGFQYSVDGGINWSDVGRGFEPNAMFIKTTEIQIKTLTVGKEAEFGLSYTVQDTGLDGLSQESDHAVLGIPADINQACIELASFFYLKSSKGSLDSIGKKSKSSGVVGGGSTTYDKNEEQNILNTLTNYKKIIWA
ncbi:unnamed protein product, partial [marine sediment metagenome]